MLGVVVALEVALAGVDMFGLRGVHVYVGVRACCLDAAHIDCLVAAEFDAVELLELFPSTLGPGESKTMSSSSPPCASCCWTPGRSCWTYLGLRRLKTMRLLMSEFLSLSAWLSQILLLLLMT